MIIFSHHSPLKKQKNKSLLIMKSDWSRLCLSLLFLCFTEGRKKVILVWIDMSE